MMSQLETIPSKITTAHRAKAACVYIRQSSLGQVIRHAESTELQYRLVERAISLGWPRERVQVIDEDLGKSGTSATDRLGFQHLMAEIGLAHVGLVISLDASRLARNNSDWYQLLELCSLFGTLIADSEQLYDPQIYHDRLLLGLSGMMSEAELHHLKLRLQAGERHKAERGELRQRLPVGLLRLRDGQIVLNPDEEIQARLRLVFQKFRELGSAQAVMRYWQRNQLPLPVRLPVGPEPHEVVWRRASSGMVARILRNPAYAGAYVYGQRIRIATHCRPGQPFSGKVCLPVDKWPVCLQDVYPAYITWEEFIANQARLRDNQNCYREGRRGVPRSGQALLQGIAVCGRCGRRLRLRYTGDHGQYPIYQCDADQQEYGGKSCQRVRTSSLDAEVERAVLAALEPDQIALALAALTELEREEAALRQQWQLRIERAKYEAERAGRQYMAVEPEDRLVARTLERLWEERLRAVEEVEHAFQRWSGEHQVVVTGADRSDILALGENLPKVWHAPTTTNADRKGLLRLVIKEVIVDGKRERGRVWLQINWQTGATSEHRVMRGVGCYTDHAHFEELQRRVRELNAERKMDEEIAAILNAEGLRTTRGRRFNRDAVWNLRKIWQIPTIEESETEHNPLRWKNGTYSVEGVAAAVGVKCNTVYRWLWEGRLKGEQLAREMPWRIPLDEKQIRALKGYVKRGKRPKKRAL